MEIWYLLQSLTHLIYFSFLKIHLLIIFGWLINVLPYFTGLIFQSVGGLSIPAELYLFGFFFFFYLVLFLFIYF